MSPIPRMAGAPTMYTAPAIRLYSPDSCHAFRPPGSITITSAFEGSAVLGWYSQAGTHTFGAAGNSTASTRVWWYDARPTVMALAPAAERSTPSNRARSAGAFDRLRFRLSVNGVSPWN